MAANTDPEIQCPNPILSPNAQGVARVAVLDATAELIVTFAHPLTPAQQSTLLDPRRYTLTGGQRLFPRVVAAALYEPPGTPPELQGRRVLLSLDGEGDFSIYTLTVSGPDIDPFFASHPLRFRLACDDPFDCRPPAPPAAPEPDLAVVIDYLAKDYASFRQALLDFLPTRLPAWTERSEADLGMTLLELFAATGDTLSYLQDRVANEAFLDSATQRRSVAGHLALLGYRLDEGAAAHTWLQFQVNTLHTLSDSTQPGVTGFPVSNRPLRDTDPILVFETLGPATLRPEHNAMRLYDWGNANCCLPRDALQTALDGSFPDLHAGDYLLFDDGSGQRDTVRLTAPPEITLPFSPDAPPPDITVVRWSAATPLTHDYCVPDVTVRGNLVPATHGETVVGEILRELTPDEIAEWTAEIARRQPGQYVPRQRLPLVRAPLAHLDAGTLALAASVSAAPTDSVSELTVEVDNRMWQERPSLLDSRPDDTHFRVESDDEGEATVVFGDGVFGQRPDERADVTATYRVGGGSGGNVSADTLTLPRDPNPTPWLVSVTNPLPATGGRDLESRDHARRFAPARFQTPLVAVTVADYQAAAQAFADPSGDHPILRAGADFRWTGSWLTVTLAVEPRDTVTTAARTGDLDPELRAELLAYLDTRRLAGYDLDVTRALYVPIELEVDVCLRTGFLPDAVRQELLGELGSGVLPGGRAGFFHFGSFTFGDAVYVSRIYARVMAVAGVASAQIARLARLHAIQPDQETALNLRQGALTVGKDQIVRLDNDRNFPENGVLTVQVKGTGA
jgi:hypothetical protein